MSKSKTGMVFHRVDNWLTQVTGGPEVYVTGNVDLNCRCLNRFKGK